MFVGIDVGGTSTDAVAVQAGVVVAQAKTTTTHAQLLVGILQALDQLLQYIPATSIERIALSTTIVTNALVAGQLAKTGLLLIPGPGMNLMGRTPVPFVALSGYTDHRGRPRADIDAAEVQAAWQQLAASEAWAVSAKFSVRNPAQEQQAAQQLRQLSGAPHISQGAQLSGNLNFWRRTNSAYYNAAVWQHFQQFSAAIEQAAAERSIIAPIYILKADGGTLPLTAAKAAPVEAVFTGPAASVLGVMALAVPAEDAITLDIGGTTTDIALWRAGQPVAAARGADIDGYPTAVRSFWLHSVGVGGDSFVRREAGELKIGPQRLGTAAALGGAVATVTDAMVVAGMLQLGSYAKAQAALAEVAATGQTPAAVAEEVLVTAAESICRAIDAMQEKYAAEPVYRVADLLQPARIQPQRLVIVGGAAAGLGPLVAERLGLPFTIPPEATAANAIGAAVAQPTLEITLQADTEAGWFTIAEMGIRQALSREYTTRAQIEELAKHYLLLRAAQAGVAADAAECVYWEEFNLVRGFRTSGKRFTCRLQLKPGILYAINRKTANEVRV